MQYEDYYARGRAKFVYNVELQAFEITKAGSENQDGWIMLFLDLVYVGLFSKLASVFSVCSLSKHTFELCTAVFLITFVSRLSLDEYANRFFSNDVFHRVVFFAYTGGVFTMVINVEVDAASGVTDNACGLNIHSLGFLIGFCLSRLAIFLLYSSMNFHNRYASEQFWGVLWKIGVEVFVVIVVFLATHSTQQLGDTGSVALLYFSFVVIEVLYSIGTIVLLANPPAGPSFSQLLLQVVTHYPVDVYLHQERLGGFIMMVLGEAVISVILPTFLSNAVSSFFAFSTLVIVFSFGLQYFDSVVRIKGQGTEHAMTRSLLSAFLFTWLHPVLALFMFFSSVALGLVYKDEDFVSDKDKQILVAISIGVSVGLMEIMRTLHYGIDGVLAKKRKLWGKVSKVGFFLLHVTCPIYTTDSVASVAVHASLLVVMNVADIVCALNHRRGKVRMRGAGCSVLGSSRTSAAGRTGRTSRSSHRRETIDFGFASSLSLATRPTLSPLAEERESGGHEQHEGEREEVQEQEHEDEGQGEEQEGYNAFLHVDASFARSLENMKQRRASTNQDGILDTPWTASFLAYANAQTHAHAQDGRTSGRPRQQQHQQHVVVDLSVAQQDVSRTSRRIPPVSSSSSSPFETERNFNDDVIPEPTT